MGQKKKLGIVWQDVEMKRWERERERERSQGASGKSLSDDLLLTTEQLLNAVSFSFSLCVLLQAICAKCSKTLDNKTSRVCPECFEASLSLETLGVSEQKRKAAPEVRHTLGDKQKQEHTLGNT